MSFRHKSYIGAIAKSPVEIGKLLFLCPTEQIDSSLEELDAKA